MQPERRTPQPSTLIPLADDESGAPDWLADTVALPSPAGSNAAFRQAITPLFDERWSRSITSRVAAKSLPVGTLEVDRLVRTIATGRPVNEIPRRTAPSLRLGVQLLVDLGEAMQPFHLDTQEMVQRFYRVVGADHLELHYFRQSPLRGVIADDGVGLDAWPRPPVGQPVVVISDLGTYGRTGGLERPAATSEWLEFAAQLKRNDSRVSAIVPCAPSRIPAPIRRAIRCLSWDRSTGVRDALKDGEVA